MILPLRKFFFCEGGFLGEKMYKFLLTACLAVFLIAGCADKPADENPEPSQVAPEEQVQSPAPVEEVKAPEPAPAKAVKTKGKKGKAAKANVNKSNASKPSGGQKSEAEIKAELDQAASQLVGRASRTITPSKANKSVKASSKGYVATYVHIDPKGYSTSMRPASKAGTYNGFVNYSEQVYTCHGKTKAEALAANCSPSGSRRMKEMIHYDGHRWNY